MTPEISIVIPTDRRETRLAFALDALAAQSIDASRFEVIVVRVQGSGDSRTSAPDGLDVKFIDHTEPNAAAKRNAGWRAAQGRLVAFTDDDCRPAVDWLERLLEASDGPDVFLQGRTEPDPEETGLLAGRTATQRIAEPSPWYETCNIAYPRELLESLQGFDELYTFGGEDTDLGLRASKAGAERRYLAEAVVLHGVHSRPIHRALSIQGAQETRYALFERHPDQREALFLGVFWKSAHARLLLSVAGAAALGPRPRALLAFAPYFVPPLVEGIQRGELTAPGTARLGLEIVERIAIDLTEVIASARASVRRRTLVL